MHILIQGSIKRISVESILVFFLVVGVLVLFAYIAVWIWGNFVYLKEQTRILESISENQKELDDIILSITQHTEKSIEKMKEELVQIFSQHVAEKIKEEKAVRENNWDSFRKAFKNPISKVKDE
jgi:predicted PurR-regulated permease PerM